MSVVKVQTKGHQSRSGSAGLRIWFPISKWCSWSRGGSVWWHSVPPGIHCDFLVLTSHVGISFLLQQLAISCCPGSVSNFKSTILIEMSLFWRRRGLWILPLARAIVSEFQLSWSSYWWSCLLAIDTETCFSFFQSGRASTWAADENKIFHEELLRWPHWENLKKKKKAAILHMLQRQIVVFMDGGSEPLHLSGVHMAEPFCPWSGKKVRDQGHSVRGQGCYWGLFTHSKECYYLWLSAGGHFGSH